MKIFEYDNIEINGKKLANEISYPIQYGMDEDNETCKLQVYVFEELTEEEYSVIGTEIQDILDEHDPTSEIEKELTESERLDRVEADIAYISMMGGFA